MGSAKGALAHICGGQITHWLNPEFPTVQTRTVDLIGKMPDGALLHIELQSSNARTMPLRMAEYSLDIRRRYRQFPRRILLYVGHKPMRMAQKLDGPDLSFRYNAFDIREFEGDRLLESESLGDNVIAVLMRLKDERRAIRGIVERIATLTAGEASVAFQQLLIIARLRKLTNLVSQEAKQMPVIIDLMNDEVTGPIYRRGLKAGEQKAELAKLEGEIEGQRMLLRRQITKRFGPLSPAVEQLLNLMTKPQLETLGERLLDALTLDELFPL